MSHLVFLQCSANESDSIFFVLHIELENSQVTTITYKPEKFGGNLKSSFCLLIVVNMISRYHQILSLIEICRYDESNVDRRIELLKQINAKLPPVARINLPSLITNDFISKALDIIEERLILANTAA
jgi:hypothetical protein